MKYSKIEHMNYTYTDENGRGASIRHAPSSVNQERCVVCFRYGFTAISMPVVDLEDAVERVRAVFGEGIELVEVDD